jgi:hypothetical protein
VLDLGRASSGRRLLHADASRAPLAWHQRLQHLPDQQPMKSLKYLLFAFALAAGLSFAGDREDADAAMWRGVYAVALK